jgi:ABC-type multidrug transport system ATPase subunit
MVLEAPGVAPMSMFDFDLGLSYISERVLFQCEENHLALMGPSGSGKSSIAKALAGVAPFVGSIRFQKDLLTSTPWKRGFSFLPQDLQLLPHLNVQENILFPRGAALAPEVIEALGLTHSMERMPRYLSGGEKQRVALARTLCLDARLYILDEPFASLDKVMRARAMEVVRERLKSRPLFLITHQMDEAMALGCTVWNLDS